MALSVGNDDFQPFRLDKAFVLKYKTVKPKFGFDGLGEFVYMRTYSRVKGDGDKERWWETVERVVNGTYTMQKRWIIDSGIEWKPKKAQRSAQEMYDRIFNFKFLPPGRGLWAMGSPLTEERKLFACLNNCAYCTTQDIDKNEGRDVWKPFVFLMDCSMLGIGTGFDTRGAGGIIVKGLDKTAPETSYIIPDSREGWCESVKRLIIACVHGQPGINFDYSKIRPKGARIYGFGGVASGPEPLKILHTNIRNTFEANKNALISETTIVDIMNHIGVCVVAGNVRRTAEISFGAPDSKEYINLKNYELNPHRAAFGWTSNNSVFADIGMDYSDVAKLSAQNGEPGYAWLANMRDYGRMNGVKDGRDHRAMGGNPCLVGSK